MHRNRAQRQDDRDTRIPVPTPARRTETAAGGQVLTMQRTVGNQAFTHTIQRTAQDDLVAYASTWMETSNVKYKSRSGDLQRVDQAVTTWLTGGSGVPGNLDLNEAQLNGIKGAVTRWRTGKGPSRRDAFIDELVQRVDAVLAAIGQVRAQRARNDALGAKYSQIDPAMAGHARRQAQNITFDPTGNRFHEALTDDRDDQGQLSPAALTVLRQVAAENLGKALEFIGGVDPGGLSRDELDKLMNSPTNVNASTGQTTFPELRAYLDSLPATGDPAPESRGTRDTQQQVHDVGGTQLTTYTDPTDPQAGRRVQAVITAITKVQAQGFDVPPLRAYLPKYGRNLAVQAGMIRPGQQKMHRAEFFPPNNLVGSSELADNPLTNKLGDQYQYLSTKLAEQSGDDSMTTTMIHELGHYLHYHQNAGKFLDLTSTTWTGAVGGSAHQDVSVYAAQNPREFVAEVFLGQVYGEQYDAQVLEAYHALGGPRPGQVPTTS
ncbi:hypothetical protein [Actinokineospora enzanensis]|uniref:hypothetical protein n=1 Tax=Actinokineospora enzanensis TaxID=155975 RepID=UPI00036478CF|nr:hypothetical protein [Actinokineospora enzanensis]